MQTQPFPEIFTLIGFLPVSLRRHLNGEKGEHRPPSLSALLTFQHDNVGFDTRFPQRVAVYDDTELVVTGFVDDVSVPFTVFNSTNGGACLIIAILMRSRFGHPSCDLHSHFEAAAFAVSPAQWEDECAEPGGDDASGFKGLRVAEAIRQILL